MRIFIDATQADSTLRVFGMSLVERLLHALRRSALDLDEIRVAVRAEEDVVTADHPIRRAVELRALNDLRVTWFGGSEDLGERVSRAVRDCPESDWLILSGDTIVDSRVLIQLANLSSSVFFVSGEGGERGAILRLSPQQSLMESAATDVLDLAQRLEARGAARPMSSEDFNAYIVELRRDFEPYLFRIADLVGQSKALSIGGRTQHQIDPVPPLDQRRNQVTKEGRGSVR